MKLGLACFFSEFFADSNMVAGTAIVTTEWKAVDFESPVSPNPVVFIGTFFKYISKA